jgi:3-isopropylmalate dehydrogenase
MQAKIVLLPGDGIGPEVVQEAVKVLDKISAKFGHTFSYESHDIGGISIDKHGNALPDETVAACKKADAILLGAVGGPKWDNPTAKTRPEAGLLKIRKELGLFANLRPVKTNSALVDASPLKREIVDGVDILFFRELTGGIYFGESGSRIVDGEEESYNVASYKRSEIERIVRMAADAARLRGKHLTMVDKANVLEVSRLWRRVSEEIIKKDYADLKYDVVLVDAMAMHLISRPKAFDVVVTSNLFGDILTDEASMLPGSMGLLPSASLSSSGPGLYEPIHGSAPDIAGQGIANPLATILATAMLLRHSLKLEAEAAAIETAVDKVLNAGFRTKDIAYGKPHISTVEMGAKVCEML